jgi:hypothetical protein
MERLDQAGILQRHKLIACIKEMRAMEQSRRIQVVLRMSTITLIVEVQMNNRRILGQFRAIFNDKITRHSETLNGSYLLTLKVKKLIFPRWRLLTGLDMAVDSNCTDTIAIETVGKNGTAIHHQYLAWTRQTVEYDKWAAEVGAILDYSEHTTYMSTDHTAEPWLSMRNARMLSAGGPSMGWSAGNMSLNFLARLELRHGDKWINFDALAAPRSQGQLPSEIVNTVFRLHLMSNGDEELSTTHPTFTTHHPLSIAGDTHGVESPESLALELCVQVASNASTNLRRFRICDEHRVSESTEQPILDVYAYMDDIHRSLPQGSSYPHQYVAPYYNECSKNKNRKQASSHIICGDTNTDQGCFHAVPQCLFQIAVNPQLSN